MHKFLKIIYDDGEVKPVCTIFHRPPRIMTLVKFSIRISTFAFLLCQYEYIRRLPVTCY